MMLGLAELTKMGVKDNTLAKLDPLSNGLHRQR
jgi:hypothetical protein